MQRKVTVVEDLNGNKIVVIRREYGNVKSTRENKHGLIKFPDMNIKIPSDWKDGKNP